MKELVLAVAQQRLEETFTRAGGIAVAELELRSDLAKFLCVRVSGLIELSFKHMLTEFARRRSAPEVASYVERQLERINAPNFEQMVSTLAVFNARWRDDVSQFAAGARRAAIDGVVSVRHAVSHGENTGITLKTITDYYKLVLQVLDYMETEIL